MIVLYGTELHCAVADELFLRPIFARCLKRRSSFCVKWEREMSDATVHNDSGSVRMQGTDGFVMLMPVPDTDAGGKRVGAV